MRQEEPGADPRAQGRVHPQWGDKHGVALKGTITHSHTQLPTMGNLETTVSLRCLSLGRISDS